MAWKDGVKLGASALSFFEEVDVDEAGIATGAVGVDSVLAAVDDGSLAPLADLDPGPELPLDEAL